MPLTNFWTRKPKMSACVSTHTLLFWVYSVTHRSVSTNFIEVGDIIVVITRHLQAKVSLQ